MTWSTHIFPVICVYLARCLKFNIGKKVDWPLIVYKRQCTKAFCHVQKATVEGTLLLAA